MIVVRVVWASSRLLPRSSTTSGTVAWRRFQSRSMTAVSSGRRNVFEPPRRARFKRRTSSLTTASSHLPLLVATPFQQPRMALADELAAVGERDVELNEDVSVARRVGRTARIVAPLDQAGEGPTGQRPR